MRISLLILTIVSLSLVSCNNEEKKDDNPTPTTPSNEKLLQGKWQFWRKNVKYYNNSNTVIAELAEAWPDVIEFTSNSTLNYFEPNNLVTNGTYSVYNNKINLNFDNGNFICPISPNPYSGYLDSLSTKRLVFRDTIYSTNGDYSVSVYSSSHQ